MLTLRVPTFAIPAIQTLRSDLALHLILEPGHRMKRLYVTLSLHRQRNTGEYTEDIKSNTWRRLEIFGSDMLSCEARLLIFLVSTCSQENTRILANSASLLPFPLLDGRRRTSQIRDNRFDYHCISPRPEQRYGITSIQLPTYSASILVPA